MKTLITTFIVFSPVLAGLAIYWTARGLANRVFGALARRHNRLTQAHDSRY
jgi:hypothetical protein